MNAVPAAEVQDKVQQRGSRSISQWMVPFTTLEDYAGELKKDHDAGAIIDNIVRAATHNTGHATIQDVEGKWSAGGHRDNPWYSRVYVESSYLARGQQHRFETYCGVALKSWVTDEKGVAYGRPISAATALRVQEAHRKLGNLLAPMKDIDLRSGVLMISEGVWLPDPDETIEAAPEAHCATCSALIYYSNSQWRHMETGLAEHLVDGKGRYGAIQKLDHLADPEEVGRQI